MQRELVERAMAGDHDAFSELTRALIGKLYGIARLILRDNERAEDAVQEALVASWRHLSSLRDSDRFEAWVKRSVVRACYREARKEQRRRIVERQVEPIETVERDPSGTVADRDELERLFMRLNPEQRALIVLHYQQGLPVKETSEILGIPVGTVKSRLNRAISQMRATADADARASLTTRVQPS